MAASVQYCYFTTSSTSTSTSTSTPHRTLKKTLRNPPIQFTKTSQKPIKTPCVKDICKQGSLREAFQSLSILFTHQNPPQLCSDEAYSSVLELCASKKALSQGKQIHAHLITSNAISDSVFLSTRLVFMYGKCGSLVHAKNLFDRMPYRSIFTWNAMIGAYVTNNEPLVALELYSQMRISRVPLDACTFPSVLKACGGLKDMRCGGEIHGLAIKCGYISVVFVVNSLVAMYAKWDDLDGAKRLFERMTERVDVVSWNSIISAYSANGQSIEALRLFREMHMAGVATNTYTFVAALRACEQPFFRNLGREIHAAILKSNHQLDVYVANALVSMYARCGKMDDAARIFYKMDERDNISWNSMLSGFVQNGLHDDALWFFHEMQDAGQKPDQVSVISVIAVSGRLGNLLNGMEGHAYALKNGIGSDLQVGNTLIDMYSKCCSVNYMQRAFDMMPNKDFITWTTIIAGYAQNNCYSMALELFRDVQREGMDVDAMMIGSILLACSGLKCISHIKEIHGYIMRRGLSDLVLQNAIVDIYGVCGNIDCATRMFELMELKDVVSWTSMISCYVHNGLANEALELFHLMKETSVEPDSIALQLEAPAQAPHFAIYQRT
ncbi:hypothetical protein L1049_004717 [Liquidambar formosana]|uniref:Pentatricopeptide repeat-containing protein n=1 Tax=Liquidambar formosana TaxID=63359 RepID=A0AAP0RNY0_LIQFO